MHKIDPPPQGLPEQWKGSRVEHSLAGVGLKIDGQKRTTICIFGKADSQPLLGKYTLDGSGLAVDNETASLVPQDLLPI